METILAAIITAAVSLGICLINNYAQGKKTREMHEIQMEKTREMNEAQNQKTRELLDYRIQQLEIKQDKHNSVIERTYRLETEAEVFREQLKVANHRIEDLERKE